jgi:hypothetical protein
MLWRVVGQTRLGQPSQHVWVACPTVRITKVREDPNLKRAYDTDVAGQPVITSLRAELSRLLQGS